MNKILHSMHAVKNLNALQYYFFRLTWEHFTYIESIKTGMTRALPQAEPAEESQ